MKKLILTHKNCVDGCCAQCIIREKFGNDAQYLEIDHTDFDPQYKDKYSQFLHTLIKYKNDEVYMADICLPYDLINMLLELDNKVVILDHHSTVIPVIEKLEERKRINPDLKLDIHFTKSNHCSGSMLAWEYFNPNTKPPLFVKYVSDGDIWKFEYGDKTKCFYSGLLNNQQPKDIKKNEWLDLLHNEELVQKYVSLGEKTYLPYIEEVKSFIPSAIKVTLNGFTGLMVNADLKYKSELGNFLALESGTFGMVWDYNDDGIISCSLRSASNFNVKHLAEKFGGGGHDKSASFKVPTLEKLTQIIQTENSSNKIKFK